MEPPMATRKNELRQQISVAVRELETMAGKSTADGFKQEVFDALKNKIADLKGQLDRVLEAESVVAALAAPVPGQERPGGTPPAPSGAHKLYATIKNFKDRKVAGQLVTAVDQAYTVGMWFKAAIF